MAYDSLNQFPGLEVPIRREPFPWVNVVLFLATICTTLFVGTVWMLGFEQPGTGGASPATLELLVDRPLLLLEGLPFAAALLSILLAHEMGHYLTCRYYGINATLPYFIPAPTLVGTFGAFIKIRSPFHNRASLLEVGVAGPIAGFVVAVPILAFALTQSTFIDPGSVGGSYSLGEPLIFSIVAAVLGIRPPPGMELFIHPVGFAAWVGFLVTALNLLPIGQLDGGHMVYALFRAGHQRLSQVLVFILLPLGIFLWPGWLVWAFLLVLLGTRHPPTLDDSLPLERRQIVLGWIGLILLILCFMPVPLTIN
jgi:membrane-associated protease RseP (regulator of RpoE activity)